MTERPSNPDPWFPVVLLAIALLAAWLGIFGQLPEGVAKWIHNWQTLIGSIVAVGAAYIAVRNTRLTLDLTRKLETNRRERKHASLRATLPLALSQIGNYGEDTAKVLERLISVCHNEALPAGTIRATTFLKPAPSEALKSISEFIEYSDNVNTDVLASTIALIHIHNSRLHAMARDNNDASNTRIITRTNIESCIIDAATILAGAASAFNYVRRRSDELPSELLWDSVGGALQNIGFWEDQYPRLFENINRRQSRGPFEIFSRQNAS
jgi:hypothetical protein